MVNASVPLAVQIAEAEREVAMRRKVYPEWVARGTLKAATADQRLAAMEGVVETLRLVHSLVIWCADHHPTPRDGGARQPDLFEEALP